MNKQTLKRCLEDAARNEHHNNVAEKSDLVRPIQTDRHRALAEQPAQQKPVAWMYVNSDGECEQIEYGDPFDDPFVTPLYTRPQAREPLTDEEISAIVREAAKGSAIRRDGSTSHRIARAIEAAHGITKGNT